MNDDFAARHPRLAELFGIDLRSLALFRFTLGAVLFWTVCRGFLDLEAFYSDSGLFTRGWVMQSESPWRLSLYFLNGTVWFAGGLLALQAALAAMFMLGWRTRLASIASFVLYASLVNRNPMVMIGGDLLLVCLLFWACFLPTGTRFSVDAAIASNPPPSDNRHLSWGSAGLLLQVLSVYFFSALLKTGVEWHGDLTAVYYALSLDRHATQLGHWLLNFPLLLKLLTFTVWWLEMLAPILVFSPLLTRPLRFMVMLALIAMHIGFLLCLEIGHFPFVSLASLTVLLGGWFWDWRGRASAAAHPGTLRIYYDRDCGFCLKLCRLFQQFLVLPRAQIAPAQDTPRARALLEANNSWVVIDTDEQAHLKWAAFVVLLRHSPLLGGLYRLAASKRLAGPGTRAYDFIARHRPAFAAASARLLPQREVRWQPTAGWQRVAAAFIVLVAAWNLTTARLLPYSSYYWLEPAIRSLRIDQIWNMFAPFPLKEDGWFVIPARLADGSEIDLLHPDRGAPDYAKPRLLSELHENIRWHTLRGRLYENGFTAHRVHYARHLCNSWNRDKLADPDQASQRLMNFKLVYVLEVTPPPGEDAHTEQQVFLQHECFPMPTQPLP
ncbi:MAG TPA: HTTM domain-containing protein [Solimonas sp.]|nr:HTTM domain-containing protein [Solimonas sp.]